MTTATYRDFTQPAAENYEEFFVPTIAVPVSARLLEEAALQPGQRVIDVACGTGVIARLAADVVGAAGSVTGVDVADDMIDVATRSSSGAIDWHVADAADLPMPDRSFDVALCQMGLMFMPDRVGAAAEMRRVLRPGGRAIVTTPGPIQPPFEAMERAIVDNVNPELGGFVRAVFSMNDPDQLASVLTEAGFADVAADRYEVRLTLPAPAELLWRYISLTPLAPAVAAASDDARAAMEHQMVEACASWVSEGRMQVTQPMVVASGCRAGRA